MYFLSSSVFLSVNLLHFCAWYWSVFLCLLPVTVLQGHCWYNHSFWLSSRLTRGWPGPSAASLPAAATASVNEGHLVFPTAGWHLDLLFQSSHTCGCIPVHQEAVNNKFTLRVLYLSFLFLADKHANAKQHHNSSCDTVLGVYRKLSCGNCLYLSISFCIKPHRSSEIYITLRRWKYMAKVCQT